MTFLLQLIKIKLKNVFLSAYKWGYIENIQHVIYQHTL